MELRLGGVASHLLGLILRKMGGGGGAVDEVYGIVCHLQVSEPHQVSICGIGPFYIRMRKA